MKSRLSVLLLAAGSLSQGQTLADYLKANPVEGSLSVSPEATRSSGPTNTLSGFSRKIAKFGNVAAIVPIEMLAFDDSLSQPPNLYDGLPNEAKILYLLSTLNKVQVDKASERGLGLSDLKGEQRDVFMSFLPQTIDWTRLRRKPRSTVSSAENGSFDRKEVLAMRLRVERRLMLTLATANSQSISHHNVDGESDGADERLSRRGNAETLESADSSFGVKIRQLVPNATKKGQLDTKPLSAIVSLPSSITMGDALMRIGAATRQEIVADLRIRDRKLLFTGAQARAGDLLDAMALAVGGTYRRVGTAYLLAPDITGLGARKLRLSVWEKELKLALQERIKVWRKTVISSGLLLATKFDNSRGLAPSDSMVAEMATRTGWQRGDWVRTSDLPTELRAFVQSINSRTGGTKVDPERVQTDWDLGYRLIAPNGEKFPIENVTLGQRAQFLNNPVAPPPENHLTGKLKLDPASGRALSLRIRTKAEALAGVTLAKTFGYAELWVQTNQPALLTAAIDTGFPVRLVEAPWQSEPGDLPDLTILRDTSAAAAKRVARSESAVSSAMQEHPYQTVETDPIDHLSPFDPHWPARRNLLTSLAHTSGLKGVILVDTEPHGYEAEGMDDWQTNYRRELTELVALGYNETARLAFLRKTGIDPIDLSCRDIDFSLDLRPLFFPDDTLRGSLRSSYQFSPPPQMAGMGNEWTKFVNAANESAITSLLDEMGDAKIWIGHRRSSRIGTLYSVEALVEWTKGAALPKFVTGQPLDLSRLLYSVPGLSDIARSTRFGDGLLYSKTAPDFQPSFDLRNLPANQWEPVLSHWFIST
jgi:hypothetical protein